MSTDSLAPRGQARTKDAPGDNTVADAPTFIARLVDEMQTLFSQLDEHETLESESDGCVEVVPLLKLALDSEYEAAEIAAHWLPTTPDLEAKTLLAEQCADELRHYHLIMQRLEELGEDTSSIEPMPDGPSPLFQYLRGLRTIEERIAAGPFACEAVAEVRNAQFIAFCRSVGDEDTARLYEEIIHPEEIHHHRRGREVLERIATTPEIQARVATATRSSLAIADELRSLAEKTTGLTNIPLS
ncbi:MAG: ferritin-like domain-containing protein [Acidobacteriota bacterium]